MADPHNLAEIYSRQRNEAIEYLQSNYDASILEVENPYLYPVTLQIKLIIEDQNINLLLSLPFNFPDSFPQVKLDDQSFKKLYPLPHLNKYKTLCIYDEVVATPNPDNPIGVLEASIEKSREIILSGVLKHNVNDYTDEFETYWAEDSVGSYLSIVQPSVTLKNVYLVPFKYQNWVEQGIFADQKSEAIKWIQNLGGSFNEEEIVEVLYVPLKEPMQFPFPKYNINIFHLIKKNKSSNINDFFVYLSNSKRPSKVLFSVHADEGYSWGVWEHIKPFKKIVSNYKGRKSTRTGIDGFRTNSQHGWLELVKEFPKMEITKYSVQDVRATRLKSRGGDGKVNNIGLNVAIVGCGAVGSHIAQGLFDIGVQNLLLIDSDYLSFENINRHLCGADQVGQKKPVAVRDKLRRHYPTSQIHVSNDNILSFLKRYPKALNSYDVIIVATGHTPTEIRLNELQMNNLINKPILNVWVEPYLAGGHAVWNEPENKTALKMLFNNGIYKYQILKDGNLYSKKELGCNTSYVPYGVLELKKFIIEVMMFIQQQLNNEEKSSKLFTWLGNLTEQKKNKRLLAPKWVGASDFSFRLNDIEINHESVDVNDL
ncbi:ThiF family adenylyltransferase [Psychrobacillus sp. FSL K6-1464]|uniref:ThiF family adenylyltransferase n=1 Tax=Psychrobacillus sp. FSL K6-1464 TaxID=2921545 RepID=UPI0030F79F60